jgi:hypothetical protein
VRPRSGRTAHRGLPPDLRHFLPEALPGPEGRRAR